MTSRNVMQQAEETWRRHPPRGDARTHPPQLHGYRLPGTGELIPLLQIAPSKTDRERLLVVSPELAEVLTTIIFRVRGDRQALPLTPRYDVRERLTSPPMPYLMQRRHGPCWRVISDRHVQTRWKGRWQLQDYAMPVAIRSATPRMTSEGSSRPKPSRRACRCRSLPS